MNERRQKLELPDRRATTYEELEKRVDDHTDYIEARLSRFFAKALAAFAVLGLTSALSLLGFSIVLSNESDLNNEIQKQRYRTIMENCLDQNTRHDQAIAKAEELFDDDTRQVVTLLVAELQPKENCKTYTDERVKVVE